MSRPVIAVRTIPHRLNQLSAHFSRSFALPTPRIRTVSKMASIPKTMKAVIIEENGGPEVMQYKTDYPVPAPKEGQVLIKNTVSGINYIDTYHRSGLYPTEKPLILGRDGEGIITAVGSGEVYGLKEGDHVVYYSGGSYAEYTATTAKLTIKIPPALGEGIAVASLLQGLTALTMIREGYYVKKGDWILVHAAAGGVGLWLCQLLRAVGARVIGTASTKEKLALAHKNGAEFTINYKEEDLVQRVKEIAGPDGVHAVLDSTGKDQFDNDFEVVARKGTVISYGNSSGAVPPVAITKLAVKNVKLLRPRLDNYIHTREEFETYTNELFDFIIKDKFDVRIHKTYPLEDVITAHKDLEGRVTTGKLLLKP
ncbi:quinone oxidoreductase [Phlyctema vagabunda]|uniref:Quinone oxidoreductase n=1 Tax=Phlyctema vagabunda TaxID=108571 RepID=A0ABR4PVC8_9HELO